MKQLIVIAIFCILGHLGFSQTIMIETNGIQTMKTVIRVHAPGAEVVEEKVKYTEVRQRVVELINEWGAKGYKLGTSNSFIAPSTVTYPLENFQYFLMKED